MLGLFAGFLFGIPKHISKNISGIYTSNTNLEEISDWLTKILVGLGLTQISFIPSKVESIVLYLSYRMVNIPQNIILSVLLYFIFFGFFAGYLITRIYLSKEFAKVEDDLRNLNKATEQLDTGPKEINVVLDDLQAHLDNITVKADSQSIKKTEELIKDIIVQTKNIEDTGGSISGEQYFKQARVMLKYHNYLLAKEYYIKSYSLDKNYKAGSNAGVICSKYLKLYDDAETFFKQIIEAQPNMPLGHYNRACNFVRMNSNEEAISSLEVALKLGKEEYYQEALMDDTFLPLKDNERFKQLLPDYKGGQ
jgi:tetratricopeptide (TPR) repeat protein